MKWYTYLICFILIVVGVFCGIELYKEVKAESYVNGSIDISNKFSQEAFNYSNTSAVFYHDLYDETNTYTFEKELLISSEINAGSILSIVNIDFYNTSGNILCKSSLKISIQFLSNKTQLTLETIGQENASFLEQYFSDNGIRLSVIEIFK